MIKKFLKAKKGTFTPTYIPIIVSALVTIVTLILIFI